METRETIEVKVWKLILNPMRSNTEDAEIVAFSYEREKLVDFYNSELADEPYDDKGPGSFECHGNTHNWQKVFKKNGILEWYNPTNLDEDKIAYYGHGIQFQWVPKDIAESSIEYSGIKFIY